MTKNNILYCITMAFMLMRLFFGAAQESPKTEVTSLPQLPSLNEEGKSFGFAGMMGGLHNDVLIAAGGANFPNGLPWEGGAKRFTDAIFVFVEGVWQIASEKLPSPLAYGASVPLPEGVLVIGGEDGSTATNAVFLLRYNPKNNTVEQESYPSLPEPLAYCAAVVEDGFVYVVGGKNMGHSVNSFYRLSLKNKTIWERLPDFPGESRALHTVVVQETKGDRRLFVLVKNLLYQRTIFPTT